MSRSQKLSALPHKRSIPLVVVLCVCAYFVSYLSRLSFTSVTVEMIATEGYAKALIAIPLTALSITYGIGQLVCGFLGDRISPEKLVLAGLLISCAMNLSIPFCDSVALMTVLWSVNGFAQAMMWPSIVKILTNCLDEARYHQYIVYIGYASSLGTIVIYFCAPMAIALSNWHTVFYVAAGCALVFALVWMQWIHKAEAQYVEAPSTKNISSARTVERRPFDRVAIILLAPSWCLWHCRGFYGMASPPGCPAISVRCSAWIAPCLYSPAWLCQCSVCSPCGWPLFSIESW